MRNLFLSIFICFQIICFSQNKQILYNFESIPQSLLVNPGTDVSYKYYFGVPVLSGISGNLGSSGFSAYDLFAHNGVDFNDKIRSVINKTSNQDKLYVNQQLELFSGGFRVGGEDAKSYFSFGLYQEFDFLMYMPKDFAILALDGNRDYMGKSFNLGDLNVRAEVLSVLHLGFHKKINKKWVLGGRIKLYSSGANATSTNNSGFIYTGNSLEGTNVYNQYISSNLALQTAGIASFTKDEYKGNVPKDIAQNTFLNGSLGLGFDAGITYYHKENLQFTASVLDVGFIRHTKDLETITYKGEYQYTGLNPNFNFTDEPKDAFDEFDKAITRDTLYDKYTTWRPVKFNGSVQYSFGKSRFDDEQCSCKPPKEQLYVNGIGAQLFVMTLPKNPIIAFTTFYRRRILKKLEIKTTYTIDSYTNKNIGFGFSGTLGKFNIYALADNILEYKDVSKANSMAFQLGFNFVFQNPE